MNNMEIRFVNTIQFVEENLTRENPPDYLEKFVLNIMKLPRK